LSSRMSEPTTTLTRRPMRADARRNYDALVEAARELFAAEGTSAPLEEIARRAGVGIGTLYRHFPTRQALLEAAYLEEVQAMADFAHELAAVPPWDALVEFFRRYVGFAGKKRALNEALVEADPQSGVLAGCRAALGEAGNAVIRRAQEAGVVRPDVQFGDVGRIVAGIAMVPTTDPGQQERMLELALDGLRYRG
jgi:AcrR family transcriptional regulator